MIKIGLCVTPEYDLTQPETLCYTQILEQAKSAEKYHFDSFWVTEHHFVENRIRFTPLFALAGVASVTENLFIGTAILILPFYHPVHLAESVAMLDVMSKGKVILGLGLGWRGFEGFSVPFESRVSRYEEQLTLLPRLWYEKKVTHRGKHFNFSNLTLSIRPIQSHIPIWIGVSSSAERPLKRAAKLGDAYYIDEQTSIPLLKERLEIYKQGLKEVGKDFSMIEVPLLRDGYVAKDSDTARRELMPHLLFAYKEKMQWGSEVYRGVYKRENELNERIDKALQDTLIVGDPDLCIDKIESFRKEFGITHMAIRLPIFNDHKKMLNAIKLFGEKVIPYFK